jgi:hypothetical protein
MTFNDSSVGITYSVQTGEYYVIGKMCYVFARITLSSKGSFASNAYASVIMPIPSGSANGNSSILSIYTESGFSGLTGAVNGYLVTPSDSRVRLRMQTTTGSTSLDYSNFTNTSDFLYSIYYPV